jgi:hypothetical protein
MENPKNECQQNTPKVQTSCLCGERERENYLHILVYMQYVAQIMGVHVHETVENINIRGDLLVE